jgi:hypothetical protein
MAPRELAGRCEIFDMAVCLYAGESGIRKSRAPDRRNKIAANYAGGAQYNSITKKSPACPPIPISRSW